MANSFLSKIFGEHFNSVSAWEPLKHSFVKNQEVAEKLHNTGYTIAGKLEPGVISELQTLYSSLHNFQKPGGGMFYSVYSRDLAYRQKVHAEIARILRPVYDQLFQDYKSVLNSFIVKVKGPESEFSLHQDSTGLDETKYSCLSVWIPLQDTGVKEGCMYVVPYSHLMFSPWRGISFPAPFDSISTTVRKYLVPVKVKAGEILLFDNRLVHNSVANLSERDRVVVMSGIFPAEAPIISVYKHGSSEKSEIELIEQKDDYLLTYENFFHDCTCRPETGRTLRFVNWDTRQMSESEFLKLVKKYGLKEQPNSAAINYNTNQAIIAEPVG